VLLETSAANVCNNVFLAAQEYEYVCRIRRRLPPYPKSNVEAIIIIVALIIERQSNSIVFPQEALLNTMAPGATSQTILW
jgi:hypothetical protein